MSFLSPATKPFSLSSSSPDLSGLERRYSISRSTDSAFMSSPQTISPLRPEVAAEIKAQITGNVIPFVNLPMRDSEIVSASAPGSLQSSPRKTRDIKIPLSATPDVVDRPRTLPPKREAELQKHMREYEEISRQIKKAMEKETKEKEKKCAQKACREKKLVEYRKIWVDEIIPNWDKKKESRKTQDMWRFGLPPSVRGQIWKLAIGNELLVTKDLFAISAGHAQLTKATMFGTPPPTKHAVHVDGANAPVKAARGASFQPVSMDELLGKEGTVALVSLDLPANFPAKELFAPGGPMCKDLSEVLEAYVAYRPDVGYVPSMSYLVAGFLLNMDTFDAFTCLTNFINKPFNLAFYITDRSQMYKYTNTLDCTISTLLPKIHKHLHEVGIEPEQFIMDWFMTLYLKPLPLDIAARVMDLYLLEGEVFLFKIALALLKMYSHQFESYPKEMVLNLLNHFPPDLNEEELFETANEFNIDPKKFKKLLRP